MFHKIIEDHKNRSIWRWVLDQHMLVNGAEGENRVRYHCGWYRLNPGGELAAVNNCNDEWCNSANNAELNHLQ